MKKTTKFWLITAALLVLIGCVLFVGAMTRLNWDFHALSTTTYTTNIHEIRETFDSISLDTDTADISFVLSNDGICKVVCFEADTAKHSVTVTEGTLTVQLDEKRTAQNAIGFVGINMDSPRIQISLPNAEYNALLIRENTGDIEIPKEFTFQSIDLSLTTGDVACSASAAGMLKIKASTGDIQAKNLSAGALDLSVSTGTVAASGVSCGGDVTVGVSTGDASLAGIRCKNVISSGRTGDISLQDVIAAEGFWIERSTGDVRLADCDAAELFLKTSTGDVIGTLLSDKVFITETGTGSTDVPQSAEGGKCEITCDTGDIRITVK